MKKLILSAESLWSKYGFMDGNPFEREDLGPAFDDEPDPIVDAVHELGMDGRVDLLDLLVRRHLLPAIADATGEMPEVHRTYGHHNPIRAAMLTHENKREIPDGWSEIVVEVTDGQVLDALAEVSRLKNPEMLIDKEKA